MFNKLVFCGIIFSVLVSAIYGKSPSDFKPCKAGDELCLVETINTIISTKYSGDPELNLPSIDPFKIDEMIVKQPKSSSVNLDIVFKNIDILGYKNFRAYKVIGFGANPEGTHEIYLKGPHASMVGDYTANGKLYSLLVQGEGHSNITIGDTDIHVVISAGSTVKDGVTYMDVNHVKILFETNRMYFNFSNLFKGNKELSDKLNTILDEKWHEVYLEINGTLAGGFDLPYNGLIRKVFGSHPYSQLVEGGN